MNENQEVSRKLPAKSGSKGRKRARCSFEVKLKAVKLHLEEGYGQAMVCGEMGIGASTLAKWVREYRARGEEGLRPLPPPGGGGGRGRGRLPAPVTEKIVELKRQNPWWGIKRISQVLRRLFLMQTSAETVRVRLHEAGLMDTPRPKARRNMTRPRFFERATPNQMWQSDIFTFRLGGRYAYLIAFLDDYSRFVVGAELFRSPTAQAVIEVYRVAAGEYQPPKEMLTDNGRQYASWRGTSRFEAELKKDRVAHIRSRPQHPMTLGKVERFWSTIWKDFLVRAQFESFEAARERIKLWIKYYNHRKPHQGIGGLCPADRYFEIQSALRQTIEAGIQENLLEMALRGQPRAPFYMVGRMEGQSVILRAEKGKLKLSVTDEEKNQTNELEYDLAKAKDAHHPGNEGTQDTPQTHAPAQLQCGGEGAGGPGGVDREGPPGGNLPTDVDYLDHLQPVAGPGDGGDAAGPGKPGQSDQWRGPESALAAAPEQEAACGGDGPAFPAPGKTSERAQGPSLRGSSQTRLDEPSNPSSLEPEGPGAGQCDPAGAFRPDHGDPGGEAPGGLPQDLLPVGKTGAGGDDELPPGTGSGPAAQESSSSPAGHGIQGGEPGISAQNSQTDGPTPGHPDQAAPGRWETTG